VDSGLRQESADYRPEPIDRREHIAGEPAIGISLRETDFVSPISERIGIFVEADITQRAKRCVIEALGARKIADAHRNLFDSWTCLGLSPPHAGAKVTRLVLPTAPDPNAGAAAAYRRRKTIEGAPRRRRRPGSDDFLKRRARRHIAIQPPSTL
jgi:hypothetical protein